ncbi:MAG: DUF3352 domain-containing protein [Nocardioidaceae bacterium]
MSSTTPPGEPEHLEFGSPSPPKPRRGLVAAIVAGVVLAVGLPLGAFAVLRLLGGGGTQPHDVLPANAVANFRVDLDPAAEEKIDAIRYLRTFPAFEKYTRITDDRVDLRRVVFDAIASGAPCILDYATDVEPWLGERLGVAVMAPATGDPQPRVAAAIQVSDEAQARAGLRKLSSCGGGDALGWSYLDGYMVVSDSRQDAEHFRAAAQRRSLADTAQFRTDMERLGEPGVASAWVSGDHLFQLWSRSVVGDPGPAGAEMDRLRAKSQEIVDETVRSAAMAFRFDPRYVEIATVVTGSGYRAPADGRTADMALPESTAVAFGFAGGRRYVDKQWQLMSDLGAGGVPGSPEGAPDRLAAKVERQIGLRLPEDLKTLVGDSFTLALDGDDVTLDALAGRGNPFALDLGALVMTDIAAFNDVLATVEEQAAGHGFPLDLAVRQTDDGAVAALNDGYAARLAEGGTLADGEVFQTAVRDADQAQSVFFLSFDALESAILRQLPPSGDSQELVENLTKLEALGVSGTDRDGYSEGALRLIVGD